MSSVFSLSQPKRSSVCSLGHADSGDSVTLVRLVDPRSSCRGRQTSLVDNGECPCTSEACLTFP